MANCANVDCGSPPICDMTAPIGPYDGGLYGGYSNVRPPAHESVGLAEAALVVPRDRFGNPTPSGAVGFVGLGMSNAERTWIPFAARARANPLVKKSVRFIEAATFGWTIDEMANAADPNWLNVDSAVVAAGLQPPQVQVAWIMGALQVSPGPFPGHVATQEGYWRSLLAIAKTKFPNLRLAFLDGPQYMGYAQSSAVPAEPFYQESGFAYRQVILDQIAGDPSLSLSVVPWLSQGMYPWSNGPTTSGLGRYWNCPTDCVGDGVHQSTSGATKMGTWLESYFLGDPVAVPWFRV